MRFCVFNALFNVWNFLSNAGEIDLNLDKLNLVAAESKFNIEKDPVQT